MAESARAVWLAEVAPEWTATLAYRLVPEVETWKLTHADGRVRFAKISPDAAYPSLVAEAERMVWAAPYVRVPVVVCVEHRDAMTILVTEGLEGRDATDPVVRQDLPALVRAFGEGLANLHDAVEEHWCPFRFEIDRALAHVGRRVADNAISPAGFHPEHRHLSASAALAQLVATAPETEDLVVCHGDYCPPNVLLVGGRVTSYLDLGELGVADRWFDIAVGAWSTTWNFGAAYESLFYESYGIEPDPERIAFYRLLWECVS